ncbi:outer membrane protein assembly factor BamD [Candidatus Pelagibacter sp.]|nr:outer membrane protein assembly factor BamD [Candidatus Pelagibacter sp.]
MPYIKIIIIFTSLILISCSKNNQKISENIIQNNDLEIEMIKAYKEGVEALNSGDAHYASKKFNEAELLFPQSDWAPRASLMSAYGYWSMQYYNDSLDELKRFIEIYPNNQNLDYAYYLMAMCYYDSIVDERKDLKFLLESKKYFQILIKEFPDTDYSLDAKYKLAYINDFQAAKELYIARHYIKKQKWIPAINRLKKIINDYDTTIYIEETLHRLVEIHYIIGLESEAQKYAKTLGYNYKSSRWYKETYRVFNKDYENIMNNKKKNETKKEKLTDKIKSFF